MPLARRRGSKPNKKKLTAYIGLQSEPLGGEPLFSMSFGISLRVFCIALALKEKEGKLPDDEEDEGDEEAGDVEIGAEDGGGGDGDGGGDGGGGSDGGT